MPWFESIVSGDTFSPREAQSAGFLDQVVDHEAALTQEALAVAEALGRVSPHSFHEMRRLARGATVDVMQRERSRLSPPP
jgi:enoyl-CoA hydratase/carnithine racemase